MVYIGFLWLGVAAFGVWYVAGIVAYRRWKRQLRRIDAEIAAELLRRPALDRRVLAQRALSAGEQVRLAADVDAHFRCLERLLTKKGRVIQSWRP